MCVPGKCVDTWGWVPIMEERRVGRPLRAILPKGYEFYKGDGMETRHQEPIVMELKHPKACSGGSG